jgi:hypothetical protein
MGRTDGHTRGNPMAAYGENLMAAVIMRGSLLVVAWDRL